MREGIRDLALGLVENLPFNTNIPPLFIINQTFNILTPEEKEEFDDNTQAEVLDLFTKFSNECKMVVCNAWWAKGLKRGDFTPEMIKFFREAVESEI